MLCVTVTGAHPPSVTVRDIVLLPGVVQLTECGPTVVAVAGEAFAPKFQAYDAPAVAEPVKVMVPFWFAHKLEGAVNVTVGPDLILITEDELAEHPPEVTVSVTV
jgi:hypothetical protein